MLSVQVTGLDRQIAMTRGMARRSEDLSPVMRQFARVLRREIRDAFRRSRSPKGDRFPKLKDSTLRSRKKRKARVRTEGAGLSNLLAASIALQQGNIKPLIDTGRARRSVGVVGDRKGLRIFFVSYLRPHVTGGGPGKRRPPKRNVTPFEKQGNQLELIKRLQLELDRRIRAYVVTGRLA